MNPPLPLHPVAPIRKRLWKLGFAVGLLLLTFAIGNGLIAPERAVNVKMLGHDFLAFYTAGHYVRTDQFEKMYDMKAVQAYEAGVVKSAHLEVEKGFGPWWNPPFAALAFAPFAALDYPDALAVWAILSAVVMVLSLAVLGKILDSGSWKTWALIPLFFIASMPWIQATSHGQNTFITLGLLLATVILWRSDMGLAAGLVAGLLFYKPQHAAVVAAVLCFSMGRKAILGLGLTGITLLGLNLTALPGTLLLFLEKLPGSLHIMQDVHIYYWERHATFKAFWRLLLQGKEPGNTTLAVRIAWFASVAPFAVGLFLAAWREGGRKWIGGSFGAFKAHEHARDRLIAATIACAPLLMPFYFDYDLLLLVIPAVLWARELIHTHPRTRLAKVDRLCLTGWVGLYLWTFLNPPLAGRIRLDLTTLWVALIAGTLVYRALQSSALASKSEFDDDLMATPLTRAA